MLFQDLDAGPEDTAGTRGGEEESPFLRGCGRVDVGDIACEAL